MPMLLDFTKPHVLRNDDEYAAAVAEIDRLLDTDPPPDSEEYERLEFLSVLVQAYEDTHYPLYELTTPQDVVTFMLEQQGRSQAELVAWLGGQSHVEAFFHGLPLSLEHIAILREHLGIPADLLFGASRAHENLT